MNTVFLISIFLFFLTIGFAIAYYWRMSQVSMEYKNSKNIISGIVINTRAFLRKQQERLEKVDYEVEDLQSKVQIMMSEKEGIKNLEQNKVQLKEILRIRENMNDCLRQSENKIEKISTEITGFQQHLNDLDHKIKMFIEGKKLVNPKLIYFDKKNVLEKLTDTEREIINILTTNEKRTAPEIKKKIKKTREHTARLMRKLYEEGFIDRDTHKIPYVYMINKKLQENIEATQK